MYLAILHTPNFTFHAFGENKVDARAAMNLAWLEHQRQTGATMDWGEVSEDVVLIRGVGGRAFRDHAPHTDMYGPVGPDTPDFIG